MVGKGGRDDTTPSKKKSDNTNMRASMMEQCIEIKKDARNPGP